MDLVGVLVIILGVIVVLQGSWIIGLLLIVAGLLLGGNDIRSRRF